VQLLCIMMGRASEASDGSILREVHEKIASLRLVHHRSLRYLPVAASLAPGPAMRLFLGEKAGVKERMAFLACFC